jgi:O-antigen/teichoic acid export membrane protein
MTSARRLLRQVAGSAGVNVWLALLGLLTTPYLLLHLGRAAYGVFAMVSLVSAHLSNLELGFGHATIRYLARARGAHDLAGERAVLNTSLVVFWVGGAIGGIAFVLAAPVLATRFFHIPTALQPEAIVVFRLGGAILTASFLTSFFGAALQGLGRFDWMNGSRLAFGTVAAVVAVGAVAAGLGLQGVLVAQTAIALASALVLGRALRSSRGEALRLRIQVATLREMAAFGVVTFAAGIAYQWMINGPPVVLAIHVPSAELPAFTVPHSVLQKLTLLIASASMAFFPFASASSGQGDRSALVPVFLSHLRLTTLGMGPVAAYLAVFAQPLLAAWVSVDFADQAAPCLRLLAAAAFVLAFSGPPADVARAFGHPLWVLVYTTGVAALGLGASLILVPAYRAPGAAVALLLSVVMGTVPLLLAVAHHFLGLTPRIVIGALGRPAIALAGLWVAYRIAHAFAPGFLGALLTGVLATGVYVWLVVARVLDPRELGVLRRATAPV